MNDEGMISIPVSMIVNVQDGRAEMFSAECINIATNDIAALICDNTYKIERCIKETENSHDND